MKRSVDKQKNQWNKNLFNWMIYRIEKPVAKLRKKGAIQIPNIRSQDITTDLTEMKKV